MKKWEKERENKNMVKIYLLYNLKKKFWSKLSRSQVWKKAGEKNRNKNEDGSLISHKRKTTQRNNIEKKTRRKRDKETKKRDSDFSASEKKRKIHQFQERQDVVKQHKLVKLF